MTEEYLAHHTLVSEMASIAVMLKGKAGVSLFTDTVNHSSRHDGIDF